MEEQLELIVSYLKDISLSLESISASLNVIAGNGTNSIDDVCEKLESIDSSVESIKGCGINSMDDVCNSLLDVVDAINSKTLF